MKNTLFLVIFITAISCKKDEVNDCQILEKYYRGQECSLIVDTPPNESPWFNSSGKDPYTDKPKKYKLHTRWWNLYSKFVEKGDTIIKKKGELIFSIHKSDTLLQFNWICKDSTYR